MTNVPGPLAAIFCLGGYTGAVPDEEFRKITVDYTVEFARVLRASSPGAAFSFLSGSGADLAEQSRIALARYKGKADKALVATGFPRLYIFRPAYIYPVEPRNEPNLSYRCRASIPKGRGSEYHRLWRSSQLSGNGPKAIGRDDPNRHGSFSS